MIDADDVIKILKDNGWLDDTNLDELINNIPTAYDIDKVVEEVNEEITKIIEEIENMPMTSQ